MPHIQQVALHLDRLYTAYVTSFFFTLITTKLPPTQPQLKVIIVAY
jgi:hypothetical protein